MYNLTPDQYDAFFLAAINLVSAIHEKRDYTVYEMHLSACTAILTGQYPKQNIVELAKAFDTKQKSIDSLIKHLIGDFTYDKTGYLEKYSISMDEVKALGSI